MTKAELVEKVAQDVGLSKSYAEKAINAFAYHIMKCLKRKDKIALTGFGTWSVAKRKARLGRNPQTGATIRIAARSVPKFTPGKALKKSVQ